MGNLKHKQDVKAQNRVIRRIRLEQHNCSALNQAIDEIECLNGIETVSL